MYELTVASFNCKYFDSNAGLHKLKFMQDVFKKCDFLCIQEHWLYESQFHRFELIYSDIDYVATSAMDPECMHLGRPYGGTAIVWRRNLKYDVNIIKTCSNRLCAVKIDIDGVKLLVFTVYMPVDNGSNIHAYQDVLAEVAAICGNENASYVILAGDFNTDLRRRSLNTKELEKFCNDESLRSLVNVNCSNVDYTYESATGSRSLIDHCLVSDSLINYVKSFNAYDSIDNASDHLCIVAQFSIDCEYSVTHQSAEDKCKNTAWYKATLCDIENYKKAIDKALDAIDIPVEALKCQEWNCSVHCEDLENLYNAVIHDVCIKCGYDVIPSNSNTVKPKTVVPGWNEYVKHKKELALQYHWLWKQAGRPNSGELYTLRKQTRADYHYAMKKVKKCENMLRSEKMSNAIIKNDHKCLWKEVKHMRGRRNVLSNKVDNVSGNKNIAGLFADKYKLLYSSVGFDHSDMKEVYYTISDRISKLEQCDVSNCQFKLEDVISAVKSLTHGKSDGNQGLFSDHVIHGTQKLYDLLTKLLNAMLMHGMSPSDMLQSVMIPIPKNKRLQNNTSENFRAICLQSVLCKILDIMILNKESKSLSTSELQFGFKPKHSAALATSVMLETIDYYVNDKNIVYGMALDATKAFDRVKFSKLFKLLLEKQVNPLYLRLLYQLYLFQELKVKYGNSISDAFVPKNGVKQGGVLSPTLFSVYINRMIEELQNSGFGCNVGSKYCGIIGYADDIMLLAPTQNAMVNMIKVCERVAEDLDVQFNGKKCQSIVFSKGLSDIQPTFVVNGQPVECVAEIKYLGYCISNNRTEPSVECIVKDFNKKFHSFIGDVECASSAVKCALFKNYCTSLYGALFCDMSSIHLERLCISWRKALRRIFKLPNRTHCRFLPIISNIDSVDVLIHRRFIKHLLMGLKHDNSVVKFLFQMCHSKKLTRMGNNALYICQKYGMTLHDIDKVNMAKLDIYYSEDDIRKCSQIVELIDIRDNDILEDFLLNKSDINCIIQMLATE